MFCVAIVVKENHLWFYAYDCDEFNRPNADGTHGNHQVHDRAEVDDGDVPLLHRMKEKKEILLLVVDHGE